jgi:hypothetical protein
VRYDRDSQQDGRRKRKLSRRERRRWERREEKGDRPMFGWGGGFGFVWGK